MKQRKNNTTHNETTFLWAVGIWCARCVFVCRKHSQFTFFVNIENVSLYVFLFLFGFFTRRRRAKPIRHTYIAIKTVCCYFCWEKFNFLCSHRLWMWTWTKPKALMNGKRWVKCHMCISSLFLFLSFASAAVSHKHWNSRNVWEWARAREHYSHIYAINARNSEIVGQKKQKHGDCIMKCKQTHKLWWTMAQRERLVEFHKR